MQLENRLNRKTLYENDSQVTKDYQDTSKNDVLYNTITFGVAAVTSVALLKTGALKPIMKPLLELADNIAKNGSDKAAVTMKTIKEWSKLKRLTPAQLEMKGQKYNPPSHSIFRNRDNTLMYDVASDLSNLTKVQDTNFRNMRELINNSAQDIKILNEMIKENQIRASASRLDYSNTEFYFYMKEYLNMRNNLMYNGTRPETIMFSDKGMKEFVDRMTLTAEEAQQELKETGYRKLTLSDALELDENHRLVAKKDSKINLDISLKDEGDTFLNSINRLLKENRFGGNRGVLSSGAWKDLIIDPNIRISENGDIIDYRMTRDNLIWFADSLAKDFGLPVVKFNPAKMLGFDKLGRRNPLMAVIGPNQYSPNITHKAGQVKINDWLVEEFGESFANKNVAVINGTAYIIDENGQLKKIAENLRLHDITNADKGQGLRPLHNAQRQMAGLSTGEPPKLSPEEIENLTSFEKAKYKIGDWLDLGRHEVRPNESADFDGGIDSMSNVDIYVDKLTSKIGDSKLFRVNGFGYETMDDYFNTFERYNFRSLHGEGLGEYTMNGTKISPRMYEVTKKGFSASKAIKEFKSGNDDAAKYELEGFIKQFVVGRTLDDNMHEFFTEKSGYFHVILNQLNEGLAGSSRLLGFSVDNKGSSVELFANLIVRRALPVYLLTQIPEMLNYFSEPFFGGEDENGNRDNITKFLMRNVVKPIDIGAHRAMDLVGATKVFKFLGEMTPGSDQINELPGVYQLGLGQSKEEREDYIENGYDPVRKGRYWSSGNTPFTGGKIMHFRPNIYRRVEADVEFSDSKWGSRQEYYNNTWYPNPVNPLAPLNHFIFNRNHYDKKHYYDRPYLQTAPAGQNIPIIGPLFSSTIGRVISPPRKMHLEYWQNGFAVNPEDEKPSALLTEGAYQDNSKKDLNVFNNMQQQTAASNAVYHNSLYTSAYHAKQITSKKFMEKAGITFEQRSILPVRTYDRYNTPYEVYSTPSGSLNVVDVPDELNLYNVNQDLQRYSINKVLGTNQRVTKIDDFQGPGIPVGNDSPSVDNAFVYGLGEQFNTLADVAGLKGFALQAFVTGEANEKARTIENSGYAYSINNDFWEANLGGLGGGLSEITRRFIPKRNNNVDYVNPIRNTMPSWMPGSNYFTDFKHGDPYSKIDNGEERLPGEGYERLHNIKGLMDFNIGSSSIGYEKDYIIKHMLKADKYMSTFEEDTLEKGNEIHKRIQNQWLDSGLAIDVEGKVEDKRNGIIGWYDAKVHDTSSRTGVAIVDIKSTSAKKLDEIRASGQPLTHHMRQTNYYLWATGNTKSKGYIHYVDKENPDNTYTVGFDYSQKELETTLDNVYEARKTIRKAVEKGEIGRGELYSTLDKFRILADVAPYSQEFQDVSAQLSSENLSTEEQEEAARIRERVDQQKEPLRVYDYKFKTANLKTETVTVSKIIDNNTIVTKEYGKQHAVKFAGVNVSTSTSELFDDTRTKDEAAREAINKYMRPGSKIKISYDADRGKKYSKDSSESIRAVVHANGVNMNRYLLNKGHAKEKEDDNSPAGIRARYSSGEIAFGSAMETLTHNVVGKIPFVGSKIMQVRSPYEQYRKREVYGKDFQSWNHPIRDMLIPSIEQNIANNDFFALGGIVAGGFMGSLFGKNPYGKIVGAVVGATIPAIGKVAFIAGTDKERDWRPKRRREQEKLNEYVDVLKYVKNTRLYEQYKAKAKKEDNFDVEKFMKSKKAAGVKNKLRQQELTDFKKKVKLDFKHRDRYNFKYGDPKYLEPGMDKKSTIRAINQEISELQGQRRVTKVPVNALKAIEFKQAAEQTMYAYDPGDSLVDIMTALPKKERQYFKHFMDAPEEERQKILRIAPSYLRRALQSTWGMPVDRKPSLNEYFMTHGLPSASWIGWDESTNIDDVKVKLVHQNKLDPGEFDIWDKDEIQADEANIPIPTINARNNPREVQMRLSQILGKAGYKNVQVDFMHSPSGGNQTSFNIKKDAREDVANQISALEF